MTTANDQQLSHADRHDLDKLARWKAGLDAADESGDSSFPACAIFLVTGEDRASHDIFRRYRSAFEELGGGFHHLVIFGQHGVSTTQTAFLGQLGLDPQNVPVVAIASMAGGPGTVYTIELPKGDRDGDLDQSPAWGAAIRAVQAASSDKRELSLGDVDGLEARRLRSGSLAGTVNEVLLELGENS